MEKKDFNKKKSLHRATGSLGESTENDTIDKILSNKKVDKSTGQTQYPRTPGHHGTDDEKNLNVEE